MRLFDCFVFHNEFDVLEMRLREMSEVVDYFILVEANETQTGLPKPFHFDDNKERFTPWLEKIRHIKVTFPETLPPAHGSYGKQGGWEREHYQRNRIMDGLSDAGGNDLVLLSDVDEIVKATVLRQVIASNSFKGKLLVFAQSLHKYQLNRYEPDNAWLLGTRMIERKYVPTVQGLRLTKAKLRTRKHVPAGIGRLLLRFRNFMSTRIGLPVEIIPDAGWHFSSMGGLDAFRVKLASTVEGKFINQDDLDTEYRRLVAHYSPYDVALLPDCVAGGDFDHLIEPLAAKTR